MMAGAEPARQIWAMDPATTLGIDVPLTCTSMSSNPSGRKSSQRIAQSMAIVNQKSQTLRFRRSEPEAAAATGLSLR